MAPSKILYSSREVRQTIHHLFSDPKVRRVAISAFVGNGAEAFLPHPEGLELICWPKPGGTNPGALRRLIKRGAKVFFADSVHMKLYWASGRGAVITSANLSTNALGAGNLKELGVLLEPNVIDIDPIISSLSPHPATSKAIQELDRGHNLYQARNRRKQTRNAQTQTFGQWYKSPSRPQWKLAWVSGVGNPAKVAKLISKKRYGIEDPDTFINCTRRDFRAGDWALSFRLETERPTQIYWMFTEFIVRIPRSDRRAYVAEFPYQAIQPWPLSHYPVPPFRLDRRFRQGFKAAVAQHGAERIRNLRSLIPSAPFMELAYKHYQGSKVG